MFLTFTVMRQYWPCAALFRYSSPTFVTPHWTFVTVNSNLPSRTGWLSFGLALPPPPPVVLAPVGVAATEPPAAGVSPPLPDAVFVVLPLLTAATMALPPQ